MRIRLKRRGPTDQQKCLNSQLPSANPSCGDGHACRQISFLKRRLTRADRCATAHPAGQLLVGLAG